MWLDKSDEGVFKRVRQQEHLELYGSDADFYEEVYRRDSVHEPVLKWADRLGEGSEILVMGSGTGIVAEKLSKSHDVLGLERSRDMLEVARDRRPGVDFIHGDMRCFDINEDFDGVVAYGQPASYLSKDDVVKFAINVKDHLQGDGWLFVDHFAPDATELTPEWREVPGTPVEVSEVYTQAGGGTVQAEFHYRFKDGSTVSETHNLYIHETDTIQRIFSQKGFKPAKKGKYWKGAVYHCFTHRQ